MPEGGSLFHLLCMQKKKKTLIQLHVFIQLCIYCFKFNIVFIAFYGQEFIIYLHQITRLIIQIVRIW